MSLQPHDTPERLGAPSVEGAMDRPPEHKARRFGHVVTSGNYHLIPAPGAVDRQGIIGNSPAYYDLTGDDGIYTITVPGHSIEEYPDQRK